MLYTHHQWVGWVHWNTPTSLFGKKNAIIFPILPIQLAWNFSTCFNRLRNFILIDFLTTNEVINWKIKAWKCLLLDTGVTPCYYFWKNSCINVFFFIALCWQDIPIVKPCCEDLINSFSTRYWVILCLTSDSIILHKIRVKYTGL